VSGPPDLGGFSDVDRTGDAGAYAAFLDEVRDLPPVAEWKERSFAALRPRAGAVLLDVGCGTGEDAVALAALVAPGGRAIGVDASEAMIAEARRRADAAGETAVEFLRSDATALDLPDGAVDGARAERLLMHLDDPARAVAEMARVVRPGGAVVAAEPDWGTLAIDSDDAKAAAAVAAAAARRVRSPLAGRSLRRLFLDAGLADVTAVARALLVTDRGRAEVLFDLAGAVRQAVADGELGEERAEAWLESFRSAAGGGRGLVAMTALMATGQVR
jgi:SAM-dependent methyltransferase